MMHSKLASVHCPSQWNLVWLLCLVSLAWSKAIRADEFETVSGRAMGTSYSLKFSDRGLKISKGELATLVSDELERIESIFSLYRASSEINRLNAALSGEWIQVSEDLYAVASYAAELYKKTGGAFDPTVRPLIELWQGDRLSGEWKPPSRESVEAFLKTVGVSHLEFQRDPPAIQKDASQVQLDLNALVEGWAIERVLDLLGRKGCESALFELGGEYGAIGFKSDDEAWRIGIEDPQAPAKVYATLSLHDEALCTSGTYRQTRQHAGRHYSHIIDPRTGYPVEHDCLSVSVLQSNAMIADGWATALMVLGPDKGLELADEFGLAASFACRSTNSLSPRLSKLAYGKIVLTNELVESKLGIWSLVLGAVMVSTFAVSLLYAFRKRQRS